MTRKLTFVLLVFCVSAALLVTTGLCQQPKRTSISLDGTWQIEDSVLGEAPPHSFTHTVPVPGLVHSAEPSFPDVDEYQTKQLLYNLMVKDLYPKDQYEKLGDVRGITTQTRRYFWYRRTFIAPSPHRVAMLRVNKAQFGMTVWMNGVEVGTHYPCFTAAIMDVSRAIKWGQKNEIVIRIGAHPGMLPKNVSQGTDFEKNSWTPGIYDDVTLAAMNNPVIESIQAAPHIDNGTVILQSVLRNVASTPVSTLLKQIVRERISREVAGVASMRITLQPGEERTVIQTVSLLHPHLWSPEDPFLYDASTSTSGDEVSTRFGMREFHFDTVTRRAYLNGHPYFLRGSNITLHRFFEDPDSGTLPWNDKWTKKLLVDIPKRMHWNTFRFCIGPVPDRWLQIADEYGLLIENEYFVWTANAVPDHVIADYDTNEMITEYKEWLRDNWNHPSVVIWDATNESILPQFTDDIIPAVRGLDLSHRPWEDSYNAPAGVNDPVEDHQYLFHRPNFKIQDLEQMSGPLPSASTSKSAHAMILNEYGWLWLNRDGSPTLLTDKLYPKIMAGKPDTAAARFAMQNYLLAGETEFWRAYRYYAGVLHFVYLTASGPQAFTSDNFQNVKELKLNPGFERAMSQAFNPLGVYLNFWTPQLKLGSKEGFTILMVNDDNRERKGKLDLRLIDAAGKESAEMERDFYLPPLGAQSYRLQLNVSGKSGEGSLDAVATPDDEALRPVTSHRVVMLQ